MSDWTPDIARLRALEDEEWSQVERHFCGRLHAYALRRSGDVQSAEDIVQETFLGAVRGIDEFDPRYTFEQYLFGICRNRSIDHMRRRRARLLPQAADEEGQAALDQIAHQSETPSAIVRGIELSDRARELLGEILEDWVEESWQEGEYQRLSVMEALFSGGWRNRDTWQPMGLRDETAVAGIKFRALKRLRQLAAVRESGSDLLRWLAAAEEGHRILDLDVQTVWRERRVSCPDRHWLARHLEGSLEEGAEGFVRFHLVDMTCPWCLANVDDLRRSGSTAPASGAVERLAAQSRALRRSAGPKPDSNP